MVLKTTVNIDDELLKAVKELALRSRRSVTSLIEEGLRRALAAAAGRGSQVAAEDLPTDGTGGLQPGADITDNAALLTLMDGPG